MSTKVHESRLTFIKEVERDHRKRKMALYQCSCGVQKVLEIYRVNTRPVYSCGCLNKEILKGNKFGVIHGMAHDPAKNAWRNMMLRCYNESNPNYKYYGGRGIIVCDQWQDVNVFMEWANRNGAAKGLQLDRIDSNGNYEPDNCRFITKKQNCNNRRTNFRIEFKGQIKTLAEWADELNFNYELTRRMIHKGATVEAAFERYRR